MLWAIGGLSLRGKGGAPGRGVGVVRERWIAVGKGWIVGEGVGEVGTLDTRHLVQRADSVDE